MSEKIGRLKHIEAHLLYKFSRNEKMCINEAQMTHKKVYSSSFDKFLGHSNEM